MKVDCLIKQTKNLAHLFTPLLMTDRIDLIFGKLLTEGL